MLAASALIGRSLSVVPAMEVIKPSFPLPNRGPFTPYTKTPKMRISNRHQPAAQ